MPLLEARAAEVAVTAIDRIMAKVEYDPNGGCWLFSGSHTHLGYGHVGVGGGRYGRAHRVSYEAHVGPIRGGLHVCHKCDVRCCVNPDHLFLGTHQENIADKVSKGRAQRMKGEANPTSRLTASDVREIRDLRAANVFRQATVARLYGVSPTAVRFIVTRRLWPHVL